MARRMVVPGIKGMSLKEFFKLLFRNYSEVGVSDSAASLSYYLLFALFPFLFFIVTLAAYLPLEPVVQSVLGRASTIIPAQALSVVQGHLNDLLTRPRPKLLTAGLLVTVYSASRGVDAMRSALNRAYKVTESRGFIRTLLLSVGMTLLLTFLFILSFGGIIVGGHLGFWLFEKLHLWTGFLRFWAWLRWPATMLVIMLAAAISYYELPDVEQEFRFITPGSVSASLFWLAATWGFTFYTDHFNSYNVTYGSIGGVIILMTWFYLSALIFLMGGITNVVIEHASPEGKEPGARRVGEAAPAPEARLLAQVPGASKGRTAAARLKGFLLRRRHGHQAT